MDERKKLRAVNWDNESVFVAEFVIKFVKYEILWKKLVEIIMN